MDRVSKKREIVIQKEIVRDWSDLHTDILSRIADNFGIIDLISFRGVCKHWKYASSTATAEVESSKGQCPWFLLYSDETHCRLVNRSQSYTIDIPELEGATCLSSKFGWLLFLKQKSIFFFCPLSRTRIDLPEFPLSDFADSGVPTAAFTAPPSSKNCTVAVFSRTSDTDVKIDLIRRGAKNWTTRNFVDTDREKIDTVTSAAYRDEVFYFFDGSGKKVMKFQPDDEEETSKIHRIVSRHREETKDIPVMPFLLVQSRKYFDFYNIKEKLELEDEVCVSACGTALESWVHADEVVLGGDIEVADCSSGDRRLKGVWFQPRFFHSSPELSW
ncbi:hypothetical protein UlMin_031325 [Ulmus minor]